MKQYGKWAGTCSTPGCKFKPAEDRKKCGYHLGRDRERRAYVRRITGCAHCGHYPHKEWCRSQAGSIAS